MSKYRTTLEALEAHIRGEATLDEVSEAADQSARRALEYVRAKHAETTTVEKKP